MVLSSHVPTLHPSLLCGEGAERSELDGGGELLLRPPSSFVMQMPTPSRRSGGGVDRV
jgi:hypothetical protein